jgi:hypothetical protein
MIRKIGGGGLLTKTGLCVEIFLKLEDCEWESSYVQGQLLFGWKQYVRCLDPMSHF